MASPKCDEHPGFGFLEAAVYNHLFLAAKLWVMLQRKSTDITQNSMVNIPIACWEDRWESDANLPLYA